MTAKEKLVELLKDAQFASVDKCHTYKNCKSCPNDGQGMLCRVPFSVDHLIANGVTVQEWISVKEPPKEDGKYLAHIRYLTEGFVLELGFAKDGTKVDEEGLKNVWYDYDSEWGYCSVDSVTHWMPLPEQPKGE